MTQLGKLEKVDLRKVWPHEARDFSAWLAKEENLNELGQTIGVELSLLGTEVDVGRYRIDILANDSNTDHKVVIENQLEPTNHDHLGKVITYAAGLDAKYLVWIVKDVLPEHQKAIEWLNEYLDEEIRIFLLRIEVWQIGDSAFAPKFEIVSAKNDWAAVVKRSASSGAYSDTKLKQQQFWIEMCEYIRNIDASMRLQTPLPQHWFNFSLGSSLAHLATTVNTKQNRFAVDMYISNDKALFQFLKEDEEDLKKAIGLDLNWFEGEKASGFRVFRQVDNVFDETHKDENFKWLYEMVLKLRKVLGPYILEYKQN
jgi:hypothetical protein